MEFFQKHSVRSKCLTKLGTRNANNCEVILLIHCIMSPDFDGVSALCCVLFRPGAESGECRPCSLVELGCTEEKIIIKLKKAQDQITSSWKVKAFL